MNPVIKSPVIFVSGVPGAGYSTASKTLAALTGYHLIRPGELVRSQAADTASLRGLLVARMLQQNKVSEEMIVDLVKENMLENADAKGFILCGFPKNKKMANIYKKEVKTPEKVISLQVADEVATARLQKKLTELGKPVTEVLEAKDIVRSAAPKIKKVTDRFKKESVIMVNSSQGNIETLNETLQTATKSFKEFMETVNNETTKALKKDEEDFDLINLSSSVESCTLVSSTENGVALGLRELETVKTMELGDSASDTQKRVIQNNLASFSPVNIIHGDDNIPLILVEVHRAPFDAFKASIKAELDNALFGETSQCNHMVNVSQSFNRLGKTPESVFGETAQSSHGVDVSHSFNRLGKTPESTDLLNVSDDGENSSLADSTDADRYDHLEDPEDHQQSSHSFFVLDPAKYQQSKDTVPSLDRYSTFRSDSTGQTGHVGQTGETGETGQAGQIGETDETDLAGQTDETGKTGQAGQTGQYSTFIASQVGETGQAGQIGQAVQACQWDTGTEPVKSFMNKPDERRRLGASAETACMRDHTKLLNLSETTES